MSPSGRGNAHDDVRVQNIVTNAAVFIVLGMKRRFWGKSLGNHKRKRVRETQKKEARVY